MKAADALRVLTSEGVSNFGTMLSRLTIPWLATLSLRASPMQMAALLVVDVAAAGFASFALGSWVDRHGKRAVMLVADGLRFALLGVLAACVWLRLPSYGLLLAVAAANGALTIVFELARSAWMAQSVAPEDLARRNAQLSAIGSLTETAAFALGGWLFQWLGAALALAVDSLTYAVSAAALGGVNEVAAPRRETPGSVGWRRAARTAWADARVAWQSRALRPLAAIEALLAFGMASTGTTYMIYVSRDLALPTGVLGLVFACGGGGAVVGATMAPRLGRRFGAARTMAGALAVLCLGTLLVPLASGAGWLAVALLTAHQVIGDAGHAAYAVHDRTTRQTSVPVDLLARADAGVRAAGQWATLAGAVVAGSLAPVIGIRGVLWLAVVPVAIAVVVAATGLRVPAPAQPG